MADWEEDPNTMVALKRGHVPADILFLECPECIRLSYWDGGARFTCRFCKRDFTAKTRKEIAAGGVVCCDESVSMLVLAAREVAR